jgi:hypothetical protein
MKASRLFLIISLLATFLIPATESSAQTSVTLEFFPGEGSFMDGYDFSASAVQRWGESGADNPGLSPDFYLYEYCTILASRESYILKATIDYGTTPLTSISEIPSQSDSRFETHDLVQGRTYGMFTNEGDYVVIQVTSLYEQPFNDWYKYGMTFDWVYVEGGSTGDLTISLYPYDKSEFALGDSPTIGGEVLVGGQPLANAEVCLEIRGDDGEYFYGVCHTTDAQGQFSSWLEYGVIIPTGYRGNLVAWANVVHNGIVAEQTVYVPYGNEASDLTLELVLIGPDHPIPVGGWEEIGIAGTVTCQGAKVDGALVTMKVAGQTFQTTTGTHTPGSFNWYWANNAFPAGSYWVEVTITKNGYQSVTESVPFTLLGEGYSYQATLDPLDPTYAPQTTLTFAGWLTLGGEPVSGWVNVFITRPDGEVDGYSMPAGEDGRFSFDYAPPLVGDYTLIVHNSQNDQPISQTYAFTVGDAGSVTPLPTSDDEPIRQEIVFEDVVYPRSVAVGDSITVTGRLLAYYSNDPNPAPLAGWDVALLFNLRMVDHVTTNADGEFSISCTVSDLTGIVVLRARPQPDGLIYAAYWGELDVSVPMRAEITTVYTDYRVSELIEGTTKTLADVDFDLLENANFQYSYRIVGPEGTEERTFLTGFSESLYEYEMIGESYFNWTIPPLAKAGTYRIVVIITGRHFDPITLETKFYLLDGVPTDLVTDVPPPVDSWSSRKIVGTYTDYNGAPIPAAEVRVIARYLPGNRNNASTGAPRTVELPLTQTDQSGNFEVSLEALDYEKLFNTWGDTWQLTVYADKEGYATGADVNSVLIPSASNGAWIVSVSTPLDFLAAQDSLRYDQPLSFTTQLHIRYNALEDNMVMQISTEGDWRVWAPDLTRDPQTGAPNCGSRLMADVSVNGVALPGWTESGSLEQMRRWSFENYGWPYFHPMAEDTITVKKGINQELDVIVEGTLFDFRYSDGQSNPCGNGNLIPENPTVAPPYATGVSIGVSLGGGSDSVHYPVGDPPPIKIDGRAWVSRQDGLFSGRAQFKSSKELALSDFPLNLEVIERDKASGQEKPTSLITIAGSIRTDQEGRFSLPLSISKDPCDLVGTTEFMIRVSPADVAQSIDIPVELRCVPDVKFKIDSASIVQATDLSDIQPLRLVNHKPAGVRVQVEADGQIYQPATRPVNVTVQFKVEVGGKIVSQQEKILSISETRAYVNWGPQQPQPRPNSAGVGEVGERTPDGKKEGVETYPVDFVFRPDLPYPGPKDAPIEITIVVDPDEIYGAKQEHTIQGTVYAPKLLNLIFVPVDVPNVDMAFIERQVRFIEEVYPIDEWFILWDVMPNYPSADMSFELTFSFLKQVTGNLEARYGAQAGSYMLTRIIGVVDDATWLSGWFDGSAKGAQGAHITGITGGTRQAVLIRYDTAQEYTAAHEIGHSLGMYLDEEQYVATSKLNPPLFDGLPVEGLILKNGQIYESPEKAFHSSAPEVESVTDLMGSTQSVPAVAKYQRAWIIPSTYDYLLGKLIDPPGEPVLYVQGMVLPDGSFAFTSLQAAQGRVEDAFEEGDYDLQLRSSSGDVLYSTRFGETGTGMPVAFTLPFPPATARLVVVHEGTELTEIRRSPNAPTINLSTPSGVDAAGVLALNWSAHDPDDDALRFILSYHCDDDLWTLIAADLSGYSYELDTSSLPGGESCVVRVTAGDGFNSAEAVSAPFAVADKPPLVDILTETLTFEEGQTILLEAFAYDLEDGFLPAEQLHWLSAGEEIGFGDYVELALPPGKHTLVFQAEDSAGVYSEDSITITVSSSLAQILKSNLPYILGGLCLVLLLGGVLLFSRRRKQQRAQIQPQPMGQAQTVQDQQGNWWYQDPNSGGWHFWNGQTWQPVPGATPPQVAGPVANVAAPQWVPAEKPRRWGSCLLSLAVSGVLGLIVVGGISLVALKFFPKYQLPMGAGDLSQILKMGGGGLLVTILGLFLLNGGFKAIITRRAIVEDEWGRQHEKRGFGAILNGLGQLGFGVVCLVGGLGLMTLTFYQEILPWLGF